MITWTVSICASATATRRELPFMMLGDLHSKPLHVLQKLRRLYNMLREEGEGTSNNASDISTSNSDLMKKQCCHLVSLMRALCPTCEGPSEAAEGEWSGFLYRVCQHGSANSHPDMWALKEHYGIMVCPTNCRRCFLAQCALRETFYRC